MSAGFASTTSPMDYEQWAGVYDIFYAVGPELEVDFYLDLMRQCDGPVLELGVGTGRVAIPAALEGIRIVGIDLHETMLNVARGKADAAGLTPGTLDLMQGDMTDLDLPCREFGLVIIPGNSLGLVLTESGQQATITAAAEHLKPGGVLAFSMYNISDEIIDSDDSERFLLGVVEDASRAKRHILTGINSFDRCKQINDCTQFMESVSTDGEVLERQELTVVTRYVTYSQAGCMVSNAGLHVEHVYGDFDRTAYTELSDEMIFVCRKAA